MVGRGLRRVTGGVSVFAMAAGFAAAVGVGSAAAAPGTAEWDASGRYFTRTISNVSPAVGETITSKTVFQRSSLEYLYAVKDVHPTCLTYVPGSAKVNGSARSPESTGPDFVRIEGSVTQWPVYAKGGLINPKSWTLEVSYVVGADCARDTALMTTAHMSGSSGADGTYQNKGPTITVSKDATTTALAAVPTPMLSGQPVTLTATVVGAAQGNTVEFYDGATKLGEGQINGSGVGTYAWTPTTAGTRSLTAKFPGTAIANTSQSAAQDVQVHAPVTTGTTVSVPGTAVTGAQVTLSASVTPSNAAGTVQFNDNGTAIGSPVTVAAGQASLQHTFSGAGSHSITAEFVGGPGFASSAAAAQSVVVSDPDVTTSLSVEVPVSAITGSSADLTATVNPSNAVGSVQFTDNGAPIGSPVAVVNGVATLSHTFTTPGAHSVGADFVAGAGFINSSAVAQSVTVTDPDVETALSLTAPGTAETGELASFSATVSPVAAQGSVQFKVNGTAVGSPVPVSGGVASLPYTFTSAGSFAVAAEFAGAVGFTNSSATAQSVTVSDPDVTTSLSVQVPGSATTGAPVDLTATVDPANATGTVQFTDNGAPIGAPAPVVNGVATLPYTFTGLGAHSIGASFTGGPGFADVSATSPGSVVVSDPVEQTSLSVTVPTAATTGESVNLSATVSPSNAQGTVQFKIDGMTVGSPQTVSGGAASLPYTFDASGSFAVIAEFTGATGFTNSSAQAQNVTVTAPVVPDTDTTTTVTAPVTAVTGQQMTLSVAVSPVPTGGTVQFTVAGTDVGAPVSLDGSGQASIPYTFAVSGSFAVSAVYSGTTGFAGSTGSAQTVTVTDPAPVDVVTSTLVGVPGSATTGAPTTLSVTVQAQSGSAVPTGSVQFRENGGLIGLPVVLVNGSASIEHIFASVGTRQVSAVYTADAGFVGSTSVDRPVVVSASNPSDVVSSVVIASTQSPTAGAPYVLKAQVIGAPSLPGTVQFFDGGVEIGVPVPVVDGVAELTHTFTQSGPRQIHAVYSGGTGVAGSTSVTHTLDVVQSGGGTGGTGSLDLGSLGSLSGLGFVF